MTNTGIQQLDMREDKAKLTEGWRIVQFGDVVRNVQVNVDPQGSGLERYVAGEHMETDNLHIRQWGTIGDGYLGPAFHRKFVKGQVLYGSRRTYLRKVAVTEFDGICANTTFTLEANEDELLQDLLPFIMQTEAFTQHSIKQSRGSVNPYINWKDIAWYEFALPPKDEQRRIADILWAVDELYQSREYILNSISTLRQIFIDQLISNPVSSLSSSHIISLKDVCKMQNGRSFPSEDYSNEGVRLLRPGNLGKDGYFFWNDDNTKFLPPDYLNIASDYLVNPGDIVINLTAQSLEDGFMGRVCMAREGDISFLNQRIGRFVCNELIVPEYLYRCFQTTPFRNLVESNCEGSKIKHLYWRHIENFQIQLPSFQDQIRTVQRLAAVDSSLACAQKNLTRIKILRRSLREKLL